MNWQWIFLPEHGFQQYEISSVALGAANESRHKRFIGKIRIILDLGAGSHGKIGEYRIAEPTINQRIHSKIG
jgi:coproporphyrinogen III oxidase-like Fe-S oxidoreductase